MPTQPLCRSPRGPDPSHLHNLSSAGPAEQAKDAEDEAPNDESILDRVALEAHGLHVLVLGIFAKGQVLVATKDLGAARACRRIALRELGSAFLGTGGEEVGGAVVERERA